MPGIAALAVAGLTKETALLFVFAFVGYYVLQKKWRLAGQMGAALVPFALWQIVLWMWLGKPGFSSGPPFELPLWGWLSGWYERPDRFLLLGIILLPMAYVPMFLLGFRAAMDSLRNRNWHPYLLMILVHVAFMLILPGATAREPSAMLRITQGLSLAALLYGSFIRSSRILNYSLLWIGTLAILVNGSAG